MSVYDSIKGNNAENRAIKNEIFELLKRNKGGIDIWEKYKKEYKLEIDIYKSNAISLDVGIINPSPSLSSTYLAYLINPTKKKLEYLKYSLNMNEITATSKEINTESYDYKDSLHKGKPEHDLRDDVVNAIEASKGTEIGWSQN